VNRIERPTGILFPSSHAKHILAAVGERACSLLRSKKGVIYTIGINAAKKKKVSLISIEIGCSSRGYFIVICVF